MDATRALGIVSALTLVATLFWQLRSQWKKGTSEGVSRFLFIGQLCASTGFAVYSWMIEDPVFIATNVAAGVAAIVGLAMTVSMRRRARRGPPRRAWHGGGTARSSAAESHASIASRPADVV